jgi:hypothetical protein
MALRACCRIASTRRKAPHLAHRREARADDGPSHARRHCVPLAPGEPVEETFAASAIDVYGPAGFVRRFSRGTFDTRTGFAGRANENAGSAPAFSRSMS